MKLHREARRNTWLAGECISALFGATTLEARAGALLVAEFMKAWTTDGNG